MSYIGRLPNTGNTVAQEISYSPQGNVSSNTVQSAINELDSEKISTSQPLFSGNPEIRNVTPFLFFRDTNQTGTILNTNNGFFSINRSSGSDDTNISLLPNGLSILSLNLSNGDAVFGGKVLVRDRLSTSYNNQNIQTTIQDFSWNSGPIRQDTKIETNGSYTLSLYDVNSVVTGSYNFLNGNITSNLGNFWNSGNFNPSSKADLSGALFTGNISSPQVVATGNTAMIFSQRRDNNSLSSGFYSFDGITRIWASGTGDLVRISDNGSSQTLFDGAAYRQIWHSGNFNPSGKADLTGATFTGTLNVSGSNGSNRLSQYLTSNSPRWGIGANASNETGSNVGSNFEIYRYNDAGVFLGTPMSINRSTGIINFETTPTVLGNGIWHSGNFAPSGKMPVATTSSGVGQYTWLTPGIDASLFLPSGGTWLYFGVQIQLSTGIVGGTTAGIAAGGSLVGNASFGYYWSAFCWRIT